MKDSIFTLLSLVKMMNQHRLLLGLESSRLQQPENVSIIRARYAYTSEANFDTNMVVILAALLCALICALGLNSIVRCALRCSGRFNSSTHDETAARLASRGLKKRALQEIPVIVYGSSSAVEVKIKATDCPICLGEFCDGEKVRVLPKCNHGFHVRCIDTWLVSHSSCPTCRHSLLEPPPATADSGEVDGEIRHHGNAAAAAAGGQNDLPLSADEEAG